MAGGGGTHRVARISLLTSAEMVVQAGAIRTFSTWKYWDRDNSDYIQLSDIPDYDFITVSSVHGNSNLKLDMIGFSCSPSLDYGFIFEVTVRNNSTSTVSMPEEYDLGILEFYKFG